MKHFHQVIVELKRKRTVAGFLNFGIIAFGPDKKDYFIRVTKKSLIENNYFSIRYLALVDIFAIAGLILWAVGYPLGWTLFVFFFVLACVVFVNQRELEKQARIVQKTVKAPLKATSKVASSVLKSLTKK